MSIRVFHFQDVFIHERAVNAEPDLEVRQTTA